MSRGSRTDHRHAVGPAAQRDTRRVDGNVAAADDDGLSGHFAAPVTADGAQQVDGGLNACGVLAGHTGPARPPWQPIAI